MQKLNIKFKKGAASFYIVAFSTLILVVIAASFTTIVLSEMRKSENDELSQSAYDAALAGVEDAKVTFANYQKCLDNPTAATVGGLSCASVKGLMEEPNCDMVGKILGRVGEAGGEVLVEEVTSGAGGTNNMQQAYTCVKLKTALDDYTSTLTESNPTRVVKVKLGNGVKANDISRVKISWYATGDYSSVAGSSYNFLNFSSSMVAFPSSRDGMSVPPMISVGLIQTPNSFSLNDFMRTDNGTNRGTVFLVPTSNEGWAKASKPDNYTGVWNGNQNVVNKNMIIKSNNREVKNVPLGVYCKGAKDATEDFACSAWLELPQPAGGGARSDETFMFVVSLPYGKPSTSFALEFHCRDTNCGGRSSSGSKAILEGLQVEIDSTGRANNLYRRVLTRLEPTDTYFPFPLFAIELLGDGSGEGNLTKPSKVVCEWEPAFGGPTC